VTLIFPTSSVTVMPLSMMLVSIRPSWRIRNDVIRWRETISEREPCSFWWGKIVDQAGGCSWGKPQWSAPMPCSAIGTSLPQARLTRILSGIAYETFTMSLPDHDSCFLNKAELNSLGIKSSLSAILNWGYIVMTWPLIGTISNVSIWKPRGSLMRFWSPFTSATAS
jgi:hypothetical protein